VLDQGVTQRALAERVGVTHQAVSRFVRRHGLLSGGLQAYRSRQVDQVAQRRRQVRQLLEEGRTSAEVAARQGVSIATVNLDRQVLGLGGTPIRSKQRNLRGLTWEQVQARLKAVSRAQLARELGVSSSAVYRYCKKTGFIAS
jgi:DNA-binding MurR/RpiR family transcriptional regulator